MCGASRGQATSGSGRFKPFEKTISPARHCLDVVEQVFHGRLCLGNLVYEGQRCRAARNQGCGLTSESKCSCLTLRFFKGASGTLGRCRCSPVFPRGGWEEVLKRSGDVAASSPYASSISSTKWRPRRAPFSTSLAPDSTLSATFATSSSHSPAWERPRESELRRLRCEVVRRSGGSYGITFAMRSSRSEEGLGTGRQRKLGKASPQV